MRCRSCGTESWFKAPNGLAFLSVFLMCTPLSLQPLLGLSTTVYWIAVTIGAVVTLAIERILSVRYGRMVKVPVFKL